MRFLQSLAAQARNFFSPACNPEQHLMGRMAVYLEKEFGGNPEYQLVTEYDEQQGAGRPMTRLCLVYTGPHPLHETHVPMKETFIDIRPGSLVQRQYFGQLLMDYSVGTYQKADGTFKGIGPVRHRRSGGYEDMVYWADAFKKFTQRAHGIGHHHKDTGTKALAPNS